MTALPASSSFDVAVIGAGAAGLATAIFTGRLNPALRVALFDSAPKPGAKILVSGGSRCNVTNAVVTAADFNGGRPAVIRRVLNALPVPATVAFFEEIGVRLKEEGGGKLFPVTNRSRDVLDALVGEAQRVRAMLHAGERVTDVSRKAGGFCITTSKGQYETGAVVIATGGLSLPKTGSNGFGYDIAKAFGHTIVPTTPALVPLRLDERTAGTYRSLSGVAQPVDLSMRVDGVVSTRVSGALLWTHFGISGPAVLDISRHWLRATLEEGAPALEVNLSPDRDYATFDAWWVTLARSRPKLTSVSALSEVLPTSVAEAVLDRLGMPKDLTLAELSRDRRRTLVGALLQWPLPVTGSRGYDYAEVTAGGVNLGEVSPATMESRRCPGLYLVGEVLDVDGRIGGFNFQWAWSSATVAARALAARS